MTTEKEKKPSLDDLTEEQHSALAVFAKSRINTWRADLSNAWWTGDDARQPNGHLLRQIRNQLGPEWLSNIDPKLTNKVFRVSWLENYGTTAPRYVFVGEFEGTARWGSDTREMTKVLAKGHVWRYAAMGEVVLFERLA